MIRYRREENQVGRQPHQQKKYLDGSEAGADTLKKLLG